MTLSDLASIGNLVSGVAVPLSLVFLYFQLRQLNAQAIQTEKNQRAQMNQGATARGITSNAVLTQPHLSAVFIKAVAVPDQLTDEETFLLTAILRNILLNFQDSYVQHQSGLADDITFNHAEASLRFFLAIPAMRATYRMYYKTYASELTAVIDRVIAEIPLRPPIPWAEELRAALREVE